ncbi:hypothetical protein D3C75_879750 [compost metagenome]
MLQHPLGDRQRLLTAGEGGHLHLPTGRQGRPEQGGREGPAAEVQRLDGQAKRGIAGIEEPVHLGCEAALHVPVVRFGEDMITAGELYPAIADGLIGRDLELLTNGGIGRFAGALITQGADARLTSHPVVGAPVLQGDGGARVAEQGGIEGLQQRLRLETGDGRVRPACGDAFLRLYGAMAQQGCQHHYSNLHVFITLSTFTPDCNRGRAEDHAFMP